MSGDFVSFAELEAYQLCVKAGIISMSTSDDGTEGSKHILDLAKRLEANRGVGCSECARLRVALAEKAKETCECEDCYHFFTIDGSVENKHAMRNNRYCSRCGKMTKFYKKYADKDIEFDLTDETINDLKKLTGKVPDTSVDADDEL
jgi:hypothetical protein